MSARTIPLEEEISSGSIKEAPTKRLRLSTENSGDHPIERKVMYDDSTGDLIANVTNQLVDPNHRQRPLATKQSKKIKNVLNGMNSLEVSTGTLSGAVVRLLQKWVYSISATQLESFALMFPKEPWQQLSDVLHLNPSKLQLPWFLPFVFGEGAPEGSMVEKCSDLTDENVEELLAEFEIPFQFLRNRVTVQLLNDEQRARIAEYTDIDTLVWYFEELCSSRVCNIIENRLDRGEEPCFG